MKRLALVAAVVVLAACTTEDNTPAVDTATPAMAPAPATDTAQLDSAQLDSARRDSVARDTAARP